ncbi:MAG: esterase [Oscillospiraceae bacterium]|nr:esterase [Oscillospiraceae bacterium]
MKKIAAAAVSAVIAASSLSGCGTASQALNTASAQNMVSPTKEENVTSESSKTASGYFAEFPEEITEIPREYFSAAQEKGTLEELYYDTYESMTYAEKTQELKKRAIIYLPHNYSDENKYNVFYLMHGGWSNETTTLGTPDSPSMFKNVIDNAIASGDINPLIIVCPTYNNTSEQDSADYSLALRLTDNYHNELMNDLIPAVEGKYSSYAESASAEALIAARDHRGFGGFSMGSVTTWHTFEYCLDYFRYFLPMSGSFTSDGSYMDDIVKNSERSWDDFFIAAFTGTDDFAASAFERQIENMRDYTDSFRYADNERDGNLTYRKKEGYSHDGTASMEYTYNGLLRFWRKSEEEKTSDNSENFEEYYTGKTKISDVINDPAFDSYGRLIFPVDKGYYSGDTLENLRLTWYTHIDPDKTVEIANYMKNHAENGDVIFYDIYTDDEKAADPDKADTGLFFFKGNAGEKFAVCSAGGGFAYVGAMQDSFPHALELSKKGYNAFAVIYRPGAQTACEDLARAISFIFEHADELEVDTEDYSLWGGSAGARMSAWLGSYGTEYFSEKELPRPAAVIMQYTGFSDYSRNDPPTYVCVGDSDGIASWRVMKSRLDGMRALGIDTEFHVYSGLGHGFGIGTGTVAEGWLEDAVSFWEKQTEKE